jgi:radical SAM protein with 4Fe4S-binding SPASM domain
MTLIKGIMKRVIKNILRKTFKTNNRKKNRHLLLKEKDDNILLCKSRPTYVTILCQAECNYKCEFCGFDYRSNPIRDQISLKNFKIIFNKLNPPILEKICFSGQGEPLLCNDLEKMAEHVKKTDSVIYNELITNGALLKGRKLEFAARLFDHVEFSLHSLDSRVHKKITSSNTHEQVINNILNLRKANPELLISIYFSYSMRNIHEIKKHLDFVAGIDNSKFVGAYTKFYSQKLIFSDQNNSDSATSLGTHLSLYNNQDYADNHIEQAMEYAKTLNLTNVRFPPLFKNQLKERRNCKFPYKDIYINYDGTVYPCGGSEVWLYQDIKNKKFNFGNLLEQNIDEVWNSSDYQDLRQSSRGQNQNRKNSKCENCSMQEYFLDSGNIYSSHFIKL